MEEIVIRKTQENLDGILSSKGDGVPYLESTRKSRLVASVEARHLSEDLSAVEQKYGKFTAISKLNQIMFRQIGRAEERLFNFWNN